ncbi:hypothetical protein MRB53_017806 [Persea americana]|uniref:Uncharacterized protein n=1 Tax=Persea americana TaxID=3435 RepID=A0ACC2M5P7_PERAE|nr:hypothetical protein MRB53_017806 [Persea americana]
MSSGPTLFRADSPVRANVVPGRLSGEDEDSGPDDAAEAEAEVPRALEGLLWEEVSFAPSPVASHSSFYNRFIGNTI